MNAHKSFQPRRKFVVVCAQLECYATGRMDTAAGTERGEGGAG